MKKYLMNLVTLLAFTTNVFAQTTIPTNTVAIGKTGAANKTIEFNLTKPGASANPKIRYNNSTSKIQTAHDGVNFKDIGSGTGGGSRGENLDYESSTTGWTASGGTLSTTSTAANVYEGVSSGTWDSNAAAQTLTSPAVTVGGLAGTNGEMTCYIQTPSGTATHTLGIWDGSTLSQATTVTSNSNYVATTINFTFPSSGTVAVRLTSVAADEPQINHECYIGPTRNITSGVIVTDWTSFTPTGSWVTNTTYTGKWRRVGDTMELQYYLLTSGAPTATALTVNLPTGYSIDQNKRLINSETNTVGLGTGVARDNGTASYNIHAMYEPSSTSIGLVTTSSPVNSLTNLAPFTFGASDSVLFSAKVPIAGWASGSAVNASQTDYDWTSYTPTFTGFGTVTNIECQHQRVTSNLNIRCKGTTGTPTATEARISLPNGLTSADTTKIPSIQIAGNMVFNANTSNVVSVPLIEPSATYLTFGFNNASTSGLTKQTGSAFIGSSVTFNFNATIPIQGWSSNQRAPTLVGSVTSNSQSALRFEYVDFGTTSRGLNCTASPCTIIDQSGDISSVVRNAAGDYTINFTTPFSVPPTCHFDTYRNGAGNQYIVAADLTTSAVRFAQAGGLDSAWVVHCVGKR